MRLSFAVPAMAGLLLGWGALAHADAPPAAPIFYCPAPGKLAPAATPAAPATHGARVVRAAEHRRQGCPTTRVAAEHHHWREHAHGPRVLANDDVSASQAFIYRYERALHGFDARAAEEAWAEGRHPPCPNGPADRCPGEWRHDGAAMEGPALAEREIPPPPCPRRCPPAEGWRHAGAADDHIYAASPPVESRPLPEPYPPREAWRPAPQPPLAPPRLAYQRPMPPPPPAAPPRPSVHAYAWQDAQSGTRFEADEQDSERAGGWSYSETDGHGEYRHWGDHFAGEPDFAGRADGRHGDDRGERHWAQRRYRCPPPVPASSCSAGPDAPVRHADVAVAGRDAAGFLTWPGKTE